MIQSVDRALRIIELFIENETMSFTEIVSAMDLPKSTVFGLLETLEARNYISRNKRTGRYSLGVILLELGGLFSSRLGLREAAYPSMQKLCRKTNQTVQLSILNGMNVVYLEKVEPQGLVQIYTRIGGVFPAHCTGTGKMLLACLEEDELDNLLGNRELEKKAKLTITNVEILKKELRITKERGYSKDYCESNDQVVGYAMPILNFEGKVIASISVGGVVGLFPLDHEGEILMALYEAVSEISVSMGYHGRMKKPMISDKAN